MTDIPRRIRQPAHFDAHGTTFRVEQYRLGEYVMTAIGCTRARFGNREQITQDIDHATLTGKLPGKAGAP